MARPAATSALIAALLAGAVVGPALAQFPFGDPPRPPGDVPRPPSDVPVRPQRAPGPPPNFSNEPPPGAVQDPSANLQARPPRGGVQSQPLPPPPGASELRPQQTPEDLRGSTAVLPPPPANQGPAGNLPPNAAPPGQAPGNAPQQPSAAAPP